MRQWMMAAVVLAALVPSADAQRPKDPAPKPAPRIIVEPDIDVRELQLRAREMAERVRDNIDVERLQWEAQEMADRIRNDLDVEALQWRAQEMAERAMMDIDVEQLQWQAQEMAERAMMDIDVEQLEWQAREAAQQAEESMRDFHFDFDFDHDFDFQFDHDFDFDFDFDHDFQFEERTLRDQMRWEMEETREHMRDAQRDIREQSEELRSHQWQLQREMDMSSLRHVEPIAELAMAEAQRGLQSLEWSGTGDLGNIVLGGVMNRFESRAQGPRAAWAPQDPADSLYRLAREMLNRGNYRRAADLFREITDKYASSQYAPDALYWEAFALYRIGTTSELERARTVLDQQRSRYADAYARSDGASLAQRVAGALARGGDRTAYTAVTAAAGQQPTCDKEELAVRVEALNALSSIDFASARPILERVLGRQDECTVTLRKRAVFLIGKQGGESAASMLSNVVRTEPNEDVRGDAILWLSRVPGEQTVNMLDELLRTSTDERVQRTALRALAAHESPRARQIVRQTIERENTPDKVREYALTAIDGKDATPEDAAFLRNLYARQTNERMKRAVVRAVSSIGGAENHAWLMALARNNAEPMDMRAEALGRVGRSSSDVGIRELTGLYDQLAARELREQLISLYSRRKEPEATDKLIEIARNGTDPQLRRMAISALTRKNDPRTTQLLLEIIEP